MANSSKNPLRQKPAKSWTANSDSTAQRIAVYPLASLFASMRTEYHVEYRWMSQPENSIHKAIAPPILCRLSLPTASHAVVALALYPIKKAGQP
jgi:hypothetical protein